MTITRLKKGDDASLKELNLLLRQLRDDAREHAATMTQLKQLLADKNIVFVVAKDGSRIVGMATLYIMPKLAKRVGRIEDVVVDEQYRRQGIGSRILEKIVAAAKARGVSTLHVNSRPVHEAANRMYRKFGFEIKKTNPYRMSI